MAYLDNYLKIRNERLGSPKSKKPAGILKGERRKVVSESILDTLREWRRSPFENEATCRASLRSVLCLEGNAWLSSDLDAQSIVSEALRTMGAKRPTWDQGQQQAVHLANACLSCGSAVPEDLYQPGRKTGLFCSPGCARVALMRRSYDGLRNESAVFRAASRALRRETYKPRNCDHCKKDYRPFSRDASQQRYCCMPCFWAAKRKHEGKECEACKKLFLPTASDQRFCSRACIYAVALERECPGCLEKFTAKSSKAKYCSEACTAQIRKKRTLEAQGIRFVPAGLDREICCAQCQISFVARSAKPKYCGPACKRAANRISRLNSNVIYLTADMFDRTFHGRGAEIPHRLAS